jgi:hypothetical protein
MIAFSKCMVALRVWAGSESEQRIARELGQGHFLWVQRGHAQPTAQAALTHPASQLTFLRSFSSSVSLKAAISSLLYGGSSSLGSHGICGCGGGLQAVRKAGGLGWQRSLLPAASRQRCTVPTG